MELISSLQNPKVREAVRLHSSRGRKQQNRIIVFGAREVQRAIEAGIKFDSLFLQAESTASKLPATLKSDHSADILHVSDPVFEKLTYGNRVDGIVGVAQRPDKSLARFKPGEGLILVTESIEKPGNLGAIFRSADATAAGGVIVADPMCDMLHPNAIRNSTGTSFSVPSAVANISQTITFLHDHGYQIFIATPDRAEDLYSVNLDSRCAVVLGNEAHGLSDAWMNGSFDRVRLPMRGIADSLNVSVTAAVVMYEALRQKSQQSTT